MPKYAEVIYETGSHSVVSFTDEQELVAGLREQHRRAVSGEAGGPTGHPAERVKRVIIYDAHPGEDDYSVDPAAISSLTEGMAGSSGGPINGYQLVAAIRDEMSPVYPVDQGRHASQYKRDGDEMDMSFLDSAGPTTPNNPTSPTGGVA